MVYQAWEFPKLLKYLGVFPNYFTPLAMGCLLLQFPLGDYLSELMINTKLETNIPNIEHQNSKSGFMMS